MSRAEETLEHLVRDLIRERRASRRNKMLMWGGAFLLFGAALVAERFAAGELDSATEFTARVDINGPIADG